MPASCRFLSQKGGKKTPQAVQILRCCWIGRWSHHADDEGPPKEGSEGRWFLRIRWWDLELDQTITVCPERTSHQTWVTRFTSETEVGTSSRVWLPHYNPMCFSTLPRPCCRRIQLQQLLRWPWEAQGQARKLHLLTDKSYQHAGAVGKVWAHHRNNQQSMVEGNEEFWQKFSFVTLMRSLRSWTG